MGFVAEFETHCEALSLVGVASVVPDTMLLLDRQFNHGNRPVFLVTAKDSSTKTLEGAVTDAHDVAEWSLVGQAGGTRRYQVLPALSFEEQLGDAIDDLSGLEALATAEAIIERIEVYPEGWRQMGWFASREAFGRFSSFWQENAAFELHRLTRDGDSEPPGDGLTDHQREALRTAYEMGYFDIPRQASLDVVAAKLDISAAPFQSASVVRRHNFWRKQ
jgi:hypothetical protein